MVLSLSFTSRPGAAERVYPKVGWNRTSRRRVTLCDAQSTPGERLREVARDRNCMVPPNTGDFMSS